MKEKFIEWSPNDASRLRLQQIINVLASFKGMGLRLTLRQLFYQLVSHNIIANTQREYKNLGNILSKARLAGYVDWDVIEDRVRESERPPQWENVQDLAADAAAQFRLPRWADQKIYLELWCEKDALSSVLEPICRKFHVTFMVNRGYSSSSAMYESSKRITREASGRATGIIYLGDFDPSGEDMVRDVRERLTTFGVESFHVEKLALTPSQIKNYKLPPNPLKRDAENRLTDSRGAGFEATHGGQSYEVDALPPDVMQNIVTAAIAMLMDAKKYAAIVAQENVMRRKFTKAVEAIQ